MKNLKLIFGVAAIAIGSMAAFSFGPSKEKEEKNTKKAVYYWFKEGSNQFISHSELSGCDESTDDLCANGYLNVANPSNPQRPASSPDKTADGILAE